MIHKDDGNLAKRRILAMLEPKRPTLANGTALIAEALTDCDAAIGTLNALAEAIRHGIEDDSTVMDAHIGRIVREAVTAYAVSCIDQ